MPKVWPSSTFTTPSLPTLSIASAMTLPISSSAAEIAATRAICSLPAMSFDCFLDAAAQTQRVGAGGDVLQAVPDDCLSQQRRRGGAVTGHVVGGGRHL